MAEEKTVLDGTRTTGEWQNASPTVCVLPVGAFEQHSVHLPLCCDNMEAEYFAAFLAGELGAALLPAINYGTSMEHSGFKGTISLSPETLMRIIRDIAAEVERQGFRTMIIVNAHGGNYALAPAVRDINRRNGKLKIIIAGFYEFADRDILESQASGKPDLHAGEFETSIQMALNPELVKPGAVDMTPTVKGFQQSDLNSFGVGFISPEGSYGHPSLATREKGEKLIASIKQNMLPYLIERLEWLEQNRTYGKKGTDRP